jgi:hypothetical protein
VDGDHEAWATEVRDYLLGRVSTNLTSGHVKPTLHRFGYSPARRWWIFEGKIHKSLGGSFAVCSAQLATRLRSLLSTLNPQRSIVDRIEGPIDWCRTIARGPAYPPEYVTTTSSVGLPEQELSSLKGWLRLIVREWHAYTESVDVFHHTGMKQLELLAHDFGSHDARSDTEPPVTHWAHLFRRSRWGILRNVVAESLRPFVESEEIDQLPVPSEREVRFELLCLVRIARTLIHVPGCIRWLQLGLAHNSLNIDKLRIEYQLTVDADDCRRGLSTSDAMLAALRHFDIAVPREPDLLLTISSLHSEFEQILVEAKSGSQPVSAAFFQLRAFSSALTPKRGRRLIWGIAEAALPLSPADLAFITQQVRSANRDVWVFSSHVDIELVMRTVGVASGEIPSLTDL